MLKAIKSEEEKRALFKKLVLRWHPGTVFRRFSHYFQIRIWTMLNLQRKCLRQSKIFLRATLIPMKKKKSNQQSLSKHLRDTFRKWEHQASSEAHYQSRNRRRRRSHYYSNFNSYSPPKVPKPTESKSFMRQSDSGKHIVSINILDLEIATHHFENKNFAECCFFCQQCVEKALKSNLYSVGARSNFDSNSVCMIFFFPHFIVGVLGSRSSQGVT